MNFLTRALLLTTLMLSAGISAQSQSPTPPKEASGSITGHVTIAGKPAVDVPVILTTDPMSGSQKQLGISSPTDSQGRYQLTGVPAGRFYVKAMAPAFYSESERGYIRGAAVTLAEGESINDINIALRRGGVITGRITDALGRPLIRHRITLYGLDQGDKRYMFSSSNGRNQETDDRGVYRIYGLPPGRYNVSAGTAVGQGYIQMGAGSIYYPQVFYPGVGEANEAGEVEVTEGGEVAGIDIVLGRTEKRYTVLIRTTIAETGKPVAGLRCGYGSMDPTGKHIQNSAIGPETNERGECRIDGVLPGKYAALTIPIGSSALNYTYDPTPFEVTDADVNDVEIKLRAGASLSGTVVFDGLSAQEATSYLRELFIGFTSTGASGPSSRPTINPDGSFRLVGLSPGKARLMVNSFPRRNITLLRVERDGIGQSADFEIASGESITGVRLVVGVGNGVIRGELKIPDGVLPDGYRPVVTAWISAQRAGDTLAAYPRSIQSDGRGRFVFEGLVPGEYEIIIGNAFVRDESGASPFAFKRVQQTVSVTNEREAQVTITLEPLTRSQ